MSTTEDTVVVAPWGLMNKQAKQNHLRQEHKDGTWVSRDNVDTLDIKHEARHAEFLGTFPVWIRNPVIHTHGSAQPTEAEAEVLEQVRAGIDLDKPLPPVERKLLESLVDNDFRSLRVEMEQMAADAKRARLAEVETEWADKKALGEQFAESAQEAWESLHQTLIDLVQRAATAGITLVSGRVDYARNREPITFEVIGEKEARNAAINEITADLNRALLSLERQRLGAQRIVSLSGITPEAAKVLDTVPDAKSLMVEAARARAAVQIEGKGAAT